MKMYIVIALGLIFNFSVAEAQVIGNKFSAVVQRDGGADIVYRCDSTGPEVVPSLPNTTYRVRIIGGWDVTGYSGISPR